ncbi:MAG: copper-translocating P-type ATPase [Actinobacteria bacterium]|nr:copper-translocating P-type ATPase [Actinomycetota bacterium]
MSTLEELPLTIEFAVSGMTCGACAARIQDQLNKIDGVDASVNYATETATVRTRFGVQTDDLIHAVEEAGYGAALRESDAPVGATEEEFAENLLVLRNRLLVCALLTAPVFFFSMFESMQFQNWQWWALVFSAPVVTWGAWPFHRAAVMNLRHRATTMDTLISIGVVAAVAWSVWALLWGDAASSYGSMAGMSGMTGMSHSSYHVYFEVAATVTVFILTGRYLEARAKRSAGNALRALLALGAHTAVVLENGIEREVDAKNLQVNDSSIDMSMLTGESVPADVVVGDAVTGATINLTGRLKVRVSRVGADTTFAHMAKLVREAQATKAPVQKLADKVSSIFVPVVLLISLATLIAWFVVDGDATKAFTAAVAVLIIACPCALGLATPTALMVGSGRGAQLGIVIKGVDVLQSTRRIDTVVFDKTGTVTTGVMQLRNVVCAEGIERRDALRMIGALELASEHPIARAIAIAAQKESGIIPDVQEFVSLAGMGARGVVDGVSVIVGHERLLQKELILIPGPLRTALADARAEGNTAVIAAWGGSARAVCVVADQPKSTSKEAIATLRAMGLAPVLLTGDNQATAMAIALQVGIEADDYHVRGGVLPDEKVAVIRELQDRGYAVAMVGDGVNDAAALAQADVGIAMGTGTDVAMQASDLTIVSGDLRLVADAIALSRATLRTIGANVFWAFAYNAAAIPLAASGKLNPMWAGLAMACSSVFVVMNSLRLRRVKLRHR